MKLPTKFSIAWIVLLKIRQERIKGKCTENHKVLWENQGTPIGLLRLCGIWEDGGLWLCGIWEDGLIFPATLPDISPFLLRAKCAQQVMVS